MENLNYITTIKALGTGTNYISLPKLLQKKAGYLFKVGDHVKITVELLRVVSAVDSSSNTSSPPFSEVTEAAEVLFSL